MAQKKFECSKFNPASLCDYSITGEEDYVINEATDHELREHAYMDSPELREEIKLTLVDVGDSV
jgi:hypothetical protein